MNDIGRPIYVYTKNPNKTECTYCYQDIASKRSSGRQKIAWNTHINYNNEFQCPECLGLYYLNITTVITVNNVIIQDIMDDKTVQEKGYIYKPGTKKIYGRLEDVLTDISDINSVKIFDNATKVMIDGYGYKVISANSLGIKTRYLFEAIVERIDTLEN